tara:strand:+ start:4634 stop:4909 length:276 start_codon:yes stop_codon:yes gene_type:complete
MAGATGLCEKEWREYMKTGDLVRLKKIDEKQVATRTGIVVDTIQKKVWRTDELGPMIDWREVDPELHAVVMYDDCKLNIPVVELEVIDESR